MTLARAVETIREEEKEEGEDGCPFGICDGEGMDSEGEECLCATYDNAESKGEMQFEIEREDKNK